MDEKRYGVVFVTEESTYASVWDTLFSDILQQDNACYVTEPYDGDLLAVLLKKNKVQKLTGGKFNFYIAKRYKLYDVLNEMASVHEYVIVLFLNASMIHSRMPAKLLQAYKKKWPNIRYVMFYVDCTGRGVCYHADCLRKRGDVFDLLYTFDSTDAKQYGMRFWHTIYSKLPMHIEPDKDLFFCGLPINRKKTILQILDACCQHEIALKMNLICKDEDVPDFTPYGSVVELGKWGVDFWPYPQTLEETLKARCILDITQEGQSGLTLRPYEAVCYNRKLLTNNKAILNFKFYDPRFMQYFEKVEDIDWDWVKEETEVDYHYNGEFSPLRLMEDIVKSCEEK